MKSSQLLKSQQEFKKLKGRIEIDETFIKEIHKGNFKNPNDPRKQWIEPDSKSTKCCIQMAIDENKNIYAQVTNTKRLQKQFAFIFSIFIRFIRVIIFGFAKAFYFFKNSALVAT